MNQIGKSKVALITGVTGQDGAYLSQWLLSQGYTVHGIKRRSSSFNTGRLEDIYQDPHEQDPRFILHYGDMTDSTNLIRIVQQTQPDEIYNLAAQSHVAVSFETPEYTSSADGTGPLRLLEAIRILGLQKKTRFYQASTSELYGKVQEIPQRETTPFYPRSPYAAAKLYAYWIVVNYREASLVDPATGCFLPKDRHAQARPQEVALEWRRQIEVAADLLGAAPTHLDSHHGAHRLAHCAPVYLALAAEFGLPVRGGVEPDQIDLSGHGPGGSALSLNGWTGKSLGPDVLARDILAGLARLEAGQVLEIVTHPGFSDAHLRRVSSLNDAREQDYLALAALVREGWWARQNLSLVAYPGLARGR